MERTTIICHFAQVWTHDQVKGDNLLVLLALADAADDDGSVRASHQNLTNRARVNRATVYSAMAMLFKSGELLRYDAEAPDSALCIVVCVRDRGKSEACDIPNSGIRKFEADDAGCEFSDLQNVDDWTRRRQATSTPSLPASGASVRPIWRG